MTDRLDAFLPDIEPFEGADEWVAAVAGRARCTPEQTRAELARQQIRPPAGWGPQRHLHLNALLFAGVKTPTNGPRTPYIFDVAFRDSITAFGTHNENDAGKSSVIKTLRWALRGRCQLQQDVRKWMRAVVLELRVEEEDLAVAFGVNSGEPFGAVMRLRQPIDFVKLRRCLSEPTDALRDPPGTQVDGQSNNVFAALNAYLRDSNAVTVAEFSCTEDFERVMDDVMLDRLGFPHVATWQSRPREQQAHQGDGTLGMLGWPTWSSALSITEPSVPVVLGEERHAVVRLLQMYLGSPWAVTVAAIAARKGQLSSRLGTLQRRHQDQQTAHRGDLTELRRRLNEIDAALAAAPAPDDLSDLDRRMRAAADAGHAAEAAESNFRNVSLRYGEISRLLDEAESDVAALKEAKLTRRFWHALKPSCCPRCDTSVGEKQWARERQGQCSLCASPLDISEPPPTTESGQETDASTLEAYLAGDEQADIDSLDDLTAATLQVRQLERHLAVVDAERDAARLRRDEAQQNWQAAHAHVAEDGGRLSWTQWQKLVTERAVTQARIEERENVRPTVHLEQQIEAIERQQKIVLAAEIEAKARLKSDQDELLRLVSQQVATLGRSLGVRNLEAVMLSGNGQMPVIKGGERTNFGDLEPGEKLRLKISLIVALMRVGEEAGVARHPGLIVIDSLGREELNPKDMIGMLAELVKLSHEVPYLQVVLTSAYGDRLVEGLGKERVILAEAGQPLW
ncbi:hypothetical protein QQG74_06410 [Micromonospora sp. FIMYZ51]|uniref:hypothetical protein n=1 Tax=Micromonospora sp. FIMYZ51 TaxID=3051832 RepID=UPI00311EDA81